MEDLPVIPTAGTIIVRNNKVLLVKHTETASHPTDSYGFPSGKLERGENRKKCAVRELQEETGLEATESCLVEIHHNEGKILQTKNGPKCYDFTLFTCTEYSGDLTASDETEPEWVVIGEVRDLFCVGNVIELVEKHASQINIDT